MADIEKLKRKRQKNVQEQNLLTKDEILRSGRWFRHHSTELPKPILDFLGARVSNLGAALVLHEDQRSYEQGNSHSGLVVTTDGRFFEYEIDLDDAGTGVEHWDWKEKSSEFVVNARMKGTGKSYGFICVQVLKELNGTDDDGQI